jgi:ABC-type glutathione transport system ATPase component
MQAAAAAAAAGTQAMVRRARIAAGGGDARLRRALVRAEVAFAVAAALAVVTELVVRATHVAPYVLPPPSAVLCELAASLDALPREFSGGMRQRVALAHTLVRGRGFIPLDEPVGSLDALTRSAMRLWLLRAMDAHPATWVLVTHDVGEAVLLGDHVCVLSGRPATLRGWTDVPLERSERRAVAADEAGAAAGAGPAVTAHAQERLAKIGAYVRAQLGLEHEESPAGEPAGAMREVAS